MLDLYHILEYCPVFKGLEAEEIGTELNNVSYKIKAYSPDECIALSDDECRFLHIIVQGKVKGEMTDFSGKVIRIEELNVGKPLAPSFIFGKNNRFPVDVISLKETQILTLSKSSLLVLFQNNETILNNYLELLSNRAQFLTSRMRFLAFQTIKGKIAKYLIQVSKKAKRNTFELKASHTELSEIFGVTRPSLTRAMREMDKEGLIAADGKKISILDLKSLAKLVQ